MQQGLYICPETSRDIISFLEDDFSNSVKKIYLQVLVHYTKLNVHQVYETYSSNFDKRPSGTKTNIDNYFDSLIKEFVLKAQQEEAYNVIKVTSEEEIQVVRTALLSPSIRSGFQTCLNDIMGFSCTAEWIKVKIEKMQIYTLDNFKPLAGLRGACLIDGILICKGQLAEVPGTKNFEADAVTLAAHECAHYLGRMMDGNFNWSTPSGNIAERQQDLVFPSINLEAGRTMELIIFDKIQPDWRHSSENSAIQFLERLKVVETCPILRAEEHNTLNLKSRICSIVSFGIDIENQFIDFY
ncbi:hypothetical protein TcasGA2_TC006973 [Tribolium castaneum]|uniref:Uncharacterized protein n=1 Tax=Tribolium castaneum TaxID=7070 RepID=D7GYI7_TRICA|nr:hypothetical protein TcasGA2_TC006973 [Tribolium castaneum]